MPVTPGRNGSASSAPRVVVIGTGQIGPLVALAFAAGGSRVALVGRTPESAQSGVDRALAHAPDMVLAELAAAADIATWTLQPTADLDDAVVGADLVIEAVVEDLGVKHAILRRVEAVADERTIFASATSGLSITAIAGVAVRPERVAGAHFWNPPHLMRLVEIAPGEATSSDVLDWIAQAVIALGKQPVTLSSDLIGGIGNRLQYAMIHQAIALIARNLATPEQIDSVVKSGFGLRLPVIGPLETADLIGLDLVQSIESYLLPDLDHAVEPSPALLEKIRSGALGEKAGRGFYDWGQRSAADLRASWSAELTARNRQWRAQQTLQQAGGHDGHQ